MEVAILLIAVMVDIAFGEYPLKLHPTVWFGSGFNCLTTLKFKRNKWLLFINGMVIVIVYLILIAILLVFLLNISKAFNIYFYLFLSIYLLKSTFSIRYFLKCIRTIYLDLSKNNINRARINLGNLVSRDRSSLSEQEIVQAAISSAAENLNDGIIAPLFYYLVFGLTGAIVYRVINSIDAMIGYRDEKYEYFGKFAALLDDAVNIIPARITALLVLLSSFFIKDCSSKNAFNVMMRDKLKTPSINGGWPIAALAGALKITVTKPGHYSIGNNIEDAFPEKILIANRFIVLSTAIFLTICFFILPLK